MQVLHRALSLKFVVHEVMNQSVVTNINVWTCTLGCPIDCYMIINEPPHDKTNKMACALSKNSDQPGHPPSLIRVFAVRSMDS